MNNFLFVSAARRYDIIEFCIQRIHKLHLYKDFILDSSGGIWTHN
jgi:hypothetical protein